MLVTITAIHGRLRKQVIVPTKVRIVPVNEAVIARLPVSFITGKFEGRATLFWSNVVNGGAPPPRPLLGTPFEASLEFGSVSDLHATRAEHESALHPLPKVGDYHVCGRLVAALHNGAGCVVQADGMLLFTPQGVDADVGDRISFVGHGLTVTASGNPPADS